MIILIWISLIVNVGIILFNLTMYLLSDVEGADEGQINDFNSFIVYIISLCLLNTSVCIYAIQIS
jgi:hypothetical protein